MTKLVILEPVQQKLEEIAQFHYHLGGTVSAHNITKRILDTLSRIESYPASGHMPKDKVLRDAGYRYAIARWHFCVYRVADETIFVYHIAHGTSNYPSLFKELLKVETV